MAERAFRPNWVHGLVVILAGGFLLNVSSIGWGLPHIYFPDESFIINRALRMGTFNLDPEYYGYGVLHVYLLAFLYAVDFVFSYLVGSVHSADDFALAFFRDPSAIYLISRMVSVVAGTLTLYTTYLLGKNLFGRTVGLLSASALALSPLAVKLNHTAKTEPLLALAAGLMMLASVRLWEEGKARDYAFAGICYGAAISLKFPAVMLGVPFFLAHCFSLQAQNIRLALRTVLGSREFAGGLLFTGLTCIVTNPYGFLPPTRLIRDILTWREWYADPQQGIDRPFHFWFSSAEQALGIGFLGLLLAAFLLALKRGKKERWLVTAVLAFWLPLSMSAHKEVHWLLPVFPLLYILSSHLLFAWLGSMQWRRVSLALILAFCAVNLEPAWKTVDYLLILSQKDTRTLALEWVERNIPPDSKILMDKGRFMTAYNVPLKENRADLEKLYQESLTSDKNHEVMKFEGLSRYFQYRLRTVAGVTYDITPIYHGTLAPKGRPLTRDNLRSLDDYRSAGIQFIIISSNYYDRYFHGAEYAGRHDSSVPEYVWKYFHFYESLDANTRLVQQFEPKGRLGPTIKIYRLQ